MNQLLSYPMPLFRLSIHLFPLSRVCPPLQYFRFTKSWWHILVDERRVLQSEYPRDDFLHHHLLHLLTEDLMVFLPRRPHLVIRAEGQEGRQVVSHHRLRLLGIHSRRVNPIISIIHRTKTKVPDSKNPTFLRERIPQNYHLSSLSVRIGLWQNHANSRPSATKFSLLPRICGTLPISGGCRC